MPLEVFTRTDAGDRPLAVGEGAQASRVGLANATARAAGILSGMSVTAARALSHELVVLARDEDAERRALLAVADWAYQFSSRLLLYPPSALTLEVHGSLKLFGGFDALLAPVKAGLGGLGYTGLLASAPTALAAVCLARCGQERHVDTLQALPAVMAPLPLSVLDWDEKLIERFEGIGVRRLGELARLPRDGLARRFGAAAVGDLDRLFGRIPDPREPYTPPARFGQRLQLTVGVEDTTALLFVVQRLLGMLCGWLRGRGAGVQTFEISLLHGGGRTTAVPLGVRVPSREAEQLMTVVRERFASLRLPAPVLEVGLDSLLVQPFAERSTGLFERREAGEDVDLLDRLRARLGSDAVRGLSGVAEHRPEYAWRYSEPGERQPVEFEQIRPLWLLPVPRGLSVRDGRPCFQGGPLHLEPGRERIESGWWDGNDIARDYFIATGADGARFWVYRELSGERGWFLHGIFE